jgi:hypothetical protein
VGTTLAAAAAVSVEITQQELMAVLAAEVRDGLKETLL